MEFRFSMNFATFNNIVERILQNNAMFTLFKNYFSPMQRNKRYFIIFLH